jgi:hypothetical protein
MMEMHPLDKIHVVNRKDFSSSLNDLILSNFFYEIWHLTVESNSCIHHNFPEEECVAKVNVFVGGLKVPVP